jgi:catechol 2,3-dioxygenase-like lactoylglutathione lyase family enzyme
MFRGMQEMVVSVRNLESLRATLMDIGRWSAHPLPDAPAEQFKAWHVPAGCTRVEQVLMVAEHESRGTIRLVRFHGVDQDLMRPSQHSWDTGGIFDINVYVRDTQAMYRTLQCEGWVAFGPPTDYQLGDFSIRQAVIRGPDGFIMVMLQAFGKVLIELPNYSNMSRTFNALHSIRDYDVTRDFLVNKLGWQPLMERVVDDNDEPGRNMLGIPGNIARTVRRRVGIFHPDGGNDGSMQILEMKELGGYDFSSRCVAPNIGFLCARYPVTDAKAYANRLRKLGVALYTEPTTFAVLPYGTVELFSVRTPDGSIMEFFTAV